MLAPERTWKVRVSGSLGLAGVVRAVGALPGQAVQSICPRVWSLRGLGGRGNRK